VIAEHDYALRDRGDKSHTIRVFGAIDADDCRALAPGQLQRH
jgi:hypothetical protein